MVEIDTLGIDDANADILLSSYRTLCNRASSVSVIEDTNALFEIYNELFPFFINASGLAIKLKNVFEINAKSSTFHIAQLVIDHRVSSSRGSYYYTTDYCLMGIAKIDSNKYGDIFLEPKDELNSHFVNHLIAFFNRKHNLDNSLANKYSIWAADIDKAGSFFSTDMIHAIAATNNLRLRVSENFLRIGFAHTIADDQTVHIFDILSKATKC